MKVSKKSYLRMLVFLTGLIFVCYSRVNVKAAEDETICSGVYIDGIALSGLTKEEAKKKVDDYVESLKDKQIAVVLDDEIAIISLRDLGYTSNENTYLDEALNIGKTGNLVKQYKELKDVENGGLHYTLEFTWDEEALRTFVAEKCSIYDIKAVNATVTRNNGQFIYTEESKGRVLNQEATCELIENTIFMNWNKLDVVVDAVIEDDIPEYFLEDVKKCNTLLGTYHTNYATSSYDRKCNVGNAAKLINNSVVYPNEVFSCYEKMNPFTKENGYYSAGAYVNGMVSESIGGGVCQVSTTLYMALLNAELKIVERAAHSMTVAYVPIAFDAAIAGTYKDLKFSNSSDAPVLIEAIANGTTITFNVYGHETRDTANRRIEFKSEVLSKTNPPADVIKKDPTQPTTYRKVTQNAYTGYVAVLYKYVYVNGVLKDTIQINKSSYNASPAYVTVGTMEVPEESEEPEDKKEDSDDKNDSSKPNKPSKPGKPNNKPDKNEEDTSNESNSEDVEDDDFDDTEE